MIQIECACGTPVNNLQGQTKDMSQSSLPPRVPGGASQSHSQSLNKHPPPGLHCAAGMLFVPSFFFSKGGLMCGAAEQQVGTSHLAQK